MRYFKVRDLLIHLPAAGENAATPVEATCTAATNTMITAMPTGCGGASPPHTTDKCQDCTPHWSHVHPNSVGCGTVTANMSMADRDIYKRALDELHQRTTDDEKRRTLDTNRIGELTAEERKKLEEAVTELHQKLGLGKASPPGGT